MQSFAHFSLCGSLQYVFYVTHWSACMFYFIAAQYGLDQDTWIGRHFDDVYELPLSVRCCFHRFLQYVFDACMLLANPFLMRLCTQVYTLCSRVVTLDNLCSVSRIARLGLKVIGFLFSEIIEAGCRYDCLPAPVESLSNHYLFMQVCVFTVLGHHYVGYSGLWGFFCSEHSRGCLGHSLHVLQSGSGRLCAGHHHPACGAWTPHLLPIPLSTQKEAESWLIKSALWPLVRKASVQLIQENRSMQSLPDMLQNRQSIWLSKGWFLLFDQSKAMPGLLFASPKTGL